jgi:hypothetical protein
MRFQSLATLFLASALASAVGCGDNAAGPGGTAGKGGTGTGSAGHGGSGGAGKGGSGGSAGTGGSSARRRLPPQVGQVSACRDGRARRPKIDLRRRLKRSRLVRGITCVGSAGAPAARS